MTLEPEPCKPCQITRIVPTYPLFSLGCLHCGARIIQLLGTLPIPATQIMDRRRAELALWVAYGHSEAELRSLAKQTTPAISSAVGPAVTAASGSQPATKRR